MGNRVLRLLLFITSILAYHSADSMINAGFMDVSDYQNVSSFGNLLLKYYGIDSLATCLSENKDWIVHMSMDSIGRIDEIYTITVWKNKEKLHTFTSNELKKMIKLSRDHSIYFTCRLNTYAFNKVHPEFIDRAYNELDSEYKKWKNRPLLFKFPKILCYFDKEWCDSTLKKDPKKFIEKKVQRLGGYIQYPVIDSVYNDSDINCARMLISMLYVFGNYNVSKWMMDYNDAISFSITYDNSDKIKSISVTAQGRPILDTNSLERLKDYINKNQIGFKNPLKKKRIKFKFVIDNSWHTIENSYQRIEQTSGLIRYINNVLGSSQK